MMRTGKSLRIACRAIEKRSFVINLLVWGHFLLLFLIPLEELVCINFCQELFSIPHVQLWEFACCMYVLNVFDLCNKMLCNSITYVFDI